MFKEGIQELPSYPCSPTPNPAFSPAPARECWKDWSNKIRGQSQHNNNDSNSLLCLPKELQKPGPKLKVPLFWRTSDELSLMWLQSMGGHNGESSRRGDGQYTRRGKKSWKRCHWSKPSNRQMISFPACRKKKKEKEKSKRPCIEVRNSILRSILKRNNNITIMASGEHRRNPHISEMDVQRDQQVRSQNKGKELCEPIKRDLGQDGSNSKLGRKKVKVRPVKDLVHTFGLRVQKDDTCNKEDHRENAVDMSPRAGLPEKGKLEFLLGMLQRRDSHRIFAEPVDPNEVEYYYDVINEPMDFGTIAAKLNGGSYKTLQDFEHDVFLVSSNAMLFNASNTIYYRQARAIKELAQRLFHSLKTDPENFEIEHSTRRRGYGRRTKVEGELISSNSCNKATSIEIASKGCREKGRSEFLEVERRQTYRLNENKSMVSMVFNDSKVLKQDEMAPIGYIGSLLQFAKDLGPAAQMVARRKAEKCVTEALKMAHANSKPSKYQIPAVGSSAQNVATTTPSLKILENSVGSRNFMGGFPGIQSGNLNGGKASMVDKMNAWDALSRGRSQVSSRQSLHRAPGKSDLSGGINWIGSGNEASRGTKGKNILDGGITEASKITETLGDFQLKRVQNKSEGLCMNNAFNGVNTDRIIGIQSGSSECGDGKFDFLVGWNTNSSGKFDLLSAWSTNSSSNKFSFSNMMQDALNMENPMHKAEVDPLELRMQLSVPPKCIGASSSSWQHPSRAIIDGSSTSQAIGRIDLMDPYGFEMGAYQNQALDDKGGQSFRGNLEQGDQCSNWFKPAELEPKPYLDGCLQLKSMSAGRNILFPAVPSQQLSWVINPTADRGLYQIHGIADGGGPSYKSNLEQGGQVSNWFEPVQLEIQFVGDGCFQNHTKSFEMDSSGHAGKSMWQQQQQQQGWAVTSSVGHGINTLGAYELERCQTPAKGELSIVAPPEYCQKEPFSSDTDSVLQWLGELSS